MRLWYSDLMKKYHQPLSLWMAAHQQQHKKTDKGKELVDERNLPLRYISMYIYSI